MGEFKKAVDDLELKELKLKGRRFTWSNDTTQTHIDRAFCMAEWDLMLQDCSLQALSSSVSDHSPLLMVGNAKVKNYCGFRFEVFWPRIQGYHEVVQQVWERDVTPINLFLRLHKLQRTGTKLRQWSRFKIGHVKLLLCAAKQLTSFLDVVQQFRLLSLSEAQLKREISKHVSWAFL